MEKITIDIDLTGKTYSVTSLFQNSMIVKPLTASFNVKWNHHRKNRKINILLNVLYLQNNEMINKTPIPSIRKNELPQ